MTPVVSTLPQALQDNTGQFIRKIAASTTGSVAGPLYLTANYVVPAYGSNNGLPASPECDCSLLMDATGGNRTITLPAAATTPVGTTIAVQKYDASGNTVTVGVTDSTPITGTGVVAQGTKKEFTLSQISATVVAWVQG